MIAPIARPIMTIGMSSGTMATVTPTAVNLVETMEMAEIELQRDFQAASSVQVLPGRNLLVGAKSPIPKIRTLFWLRICKMLLCRPKTKPFSTLTEFAIFEKSIAYECCYMV